MAEFFKNPIVFGVIVGVLTSVALDLDAYVKHRTEHPGDAYDWGVVVARCLKGAIVSGLGAAGYSAVQG